MTRSIGAFKFIETFSQALLFISIFGTSISIFVLLIFTSTKGLKTILNHWYILFFYASIAFIIYFFILPFYQQDLSRYKLTIQNEQIINNKLDSIQNISDRKISNQRKELDSLKKIIRLVNPVYGTEVKQFNSVKKK